MTDAAGNHPIVPLLAFVDCDVDERQVAMLAALADELATARDDWVLGPPRFVDETDEVGDRTVGIVHMLYSAFDETRAPLDEDLDRKHLGEVRELVEGLRRVTAGTGIEMGLELDGDSVGWVEQGEMTGDLRVGLLEAWAAKYA
jgi:hypothetical protein